VDGVGALILASTRGTGFGGAVALGSWRGVPVLAHLFAVARHAGIEHLTAVVGPEQDAVMAAAHDDAVAFVLDDEWAEGASAGLRAGLDTMWRSSDIETAVVLDVGHPGVEPDIITRVVEAHRQGDRMVTIPKYRYARAMPVVIDRGLWPRLMGLEGPVDLVALLDAHPNWVGEVWIDRIPPALVSTPNDLESAGGAR
jgi:molybdenum cofactor cytidylyltransferase